MASTTESICNLALNQISVYEIDSITASTVEAEACNRYYTEARNTVLQAHPWSFASKYATLVTQSTTVSHYAYEYDFPSDCISPRAIYSSTGENKDIEFEIISNAALSAPLIATDEEDAELIYTAAVATPSLYPPAFVQALQFYLAFLLCQPLNADRQLKADMLQLYERALLKAKTQDDKEENVGMDTSSSILDSRA